MAEREREIVKSRLTIRRRKNSELNEYIQRKINFKNPSRGYKLVFDARASCAERAFNIKFRALVPARTNFPRRYFT